MVLKRNAIAKQKRNPFSFTRELFVLYYSVRDPRTPSSAKLVAFLAIVYLVSPIDLIPDAIPIAGFLDDLVIVPLLLDAAFRLLPAVVKEAALVRVKKHIVRLRIALAIFVLVMIAILIAIFFLVKDLLHHL